MEQFSNIDFLNLLLQDFFSLHLAIAGIGVSVFTLIYSFIYSKRNELDSYSNALKCKKDPLYGQRFEGCRIIIRRLAKINKACVNLIICSFTLCILSWTINRFISDYTAKAISLSIIILFTIIEIIIVVSLMYNIIKQFYEDIAV